MESQLLGFPSLHRQNQWVRDKYGDCGWRLLLEETKKLLVQTAVNKAEGETSAKRHAHKLDKIKMYKKQKDGEENV